MNPRIENITKKYLLGMRTTMSLANNKTSELWQQFMQRRKEIKNISNSNFYSIQAFDESLEFKDFNTNTEFEKWAAVEISDINDIPEDLETYTLKGGLYAVFVHKGPASEFQKTFQFIFGQWLPNSEYELDTRAHFELLGDKYENNSPNSEEEVWIPIKSKKK